MGTVQMEKEWLRTRPDIVVYVPDPDRSPGETNQHLNAIATPAGALLATWTSATYEGAPDQRVVASRSTDGGKTWSPPQTIDAAGPDDAPGTGMASWQFLIVSGTRIWCFYNKNVGIDDARAADTGVLRCRFSDDDGVTWSRETFDYPIEPNAISNPDSNVPPTWIVYQNPTYLPSGAVLAGFTRWASNAVDPGVGMLERNSEICFLRFENILTESDPTRLVVTTWPKSPHGLRVESPFRPGISVAQEPTVQPLSDGRLICVFRTLRGCIYFALSEDDGRTWDEPRPLRYEPGGEPILNPLAPCPLYKLSDGRFVLIFFNNDGSGHGGSGPTDAANVRNPAWITFGHEIQRSDSRSPGEPDQPLRFEPPRIFADTNWTPAPGTNRTQVATYPSLVEYRGEVIIFYPDRKHYLLGKKL
ncbi:MAG: sialidase family protein [Armatimonadota bacterium]